MKEVDNLHRLYVVYLCRNEEGKIYIAFGGDEKKGEYLDAQSAFEAMEKYYGDFYRK